MSTHLYGKRSTIGPTRLRPKKVGTRLMASVAALRGHALLNYSLAQVDDGLQVPSEARASVNNSLMLRELLVAGLGIGALPSFLARPAIAQGQLEALSLQDWADPPRHVYVVYPTQRHLLPKVRAFVDFLLEELGAPRE